MPHNLMPRMECFRYDYQLIGLHFSFDLISAVVYLAMGLMLMRAAHDHIWPQRAAVVWLMGGFVAACGVNHAFDAANVFWPLYWPQVLPKGFMVLLSVLAFVSLRRAIQGVPQ